MNYLLIEFYTVIGKAHLVNRPVFFSEVLRNAGCTHETAEKKASRGSDDYRYSLVSGKKPISIDIKRAFPKGEVAIKELAKYFEQQININTDTYLPALMRVFGINEEIEHDSTCLANALALQFKSFIDEKKRDEVDNIIASEYKRLLSLKNGSRPLKNDTNEYKKKTKAITKTPMESPSHGEHKIEKNYLTKDELKELENKIFETHKPLFNLTQSYAEHLVKVFDRKTSIYDDWKIDKEFKRDDEIEKHLNDKMHELKDIKHNQDVINAIIKLLRVEIVSVVIKTFSVYHLMSILVATPEENCHETISLMQCSLIGLLKSQIFSHSEILIHNEESNIEKILAFFIPTVSRVFIDFVTNKIVPANLSKSDNKKITDFFEERHLSTSTLRQTFNEIMQIVDNFNDDIFLIEAKKSSVVEKYSQCLQSNYKDVHIYMLDTRELADFYIEPDLLKHESSDCVKQTALRNVLLHSPLSSGKSSYLSSYIEKMQTNTESYAHSLFSEGVGNYISEIALNYEQTTLDITKKRDDIAIINERDNAFSTILQNHFSKHRPQIYNNLSSSRQKYSFARTEFPKDTQKTVINDKFETGTSEQSSVVVKREPNVKWKSIFNNSDIVYVIGGAGYGKSLFLKNIISSYNYSDLFSKASCLVIFGDIKDFIKGKGEYKSVIEFLRDNMINGSLLHSDELSVDLIRYYLNVGRCLILLDALDEVPKADREEIHKRIVTFFQTTSSNNKICITSRDRGFISADKKIEVFSIPSLNMGDIEEYVDRIIKLNVRKAFNKKNKPDFMVQTKALIEKEFLNSFLVLSLLVNIYSGEQKLPDTKISLYKKCFEYITKDREIDGKKSTEYPREKIVYFLRESTFAELSTMCLPNNKDVDYDTVVEFLLKTFNKTFTDEAVLYERIDCFLKFCAERTDLFVISQKENHFRFFHRSFFEYFHARKLFNTESISHTFNALKQFDNDSEIFELYIAICKDNNIDKYYNVVETLFDEVSKGDSVDYDSLNILMHFFSEINEEHYVNRLLRFLADNSRAIARNEGRFVNADLFNKYICSEFNETAYFFDKCIAVIEQQLINLIANLPWEKVQYLISLKYIKHTCEEYTKEPCDTIGNLISQKSVNISFFTRYYLSYYTYENAFQHILNVLITYMPNLEKKLRQMSFLNKKQVNKLKSIVYRYNKLSDEDRKSFLRELIK